MRDILLLTILIGLLPFVFMRPWTGILVWSWIGYMNPHKLGWGFTHGLPVAMVFGGLTIVMMMLSNDRKSVPITRETILLIILVVFFTLGCTVAWAPEQAWDEWNKVMKILLFTFVTMMLIYGVDRIRALLVVISLSLGFYGVKGGIFSLMTGGQYRVWGPADSFIGGNTSLGLALLMVLPLMITVSRLTRNKWLRRAGYAASFLTILAIIFTYSRGALVGLAAILPLIFLKSKKKVLLLLLIVPLAWIGPSLLPDKLIHRADTIQTYQEDNSAMQRIQAWGVAWNVALSNPVLGAGFGFSAVEPSKWLKYAMFLGSWDNKSRTAHSIYFQMLGEHGFVGLILFCLLLVFTYRKLSNVRKIVRSSGDHAELGEFAAAIQIGLVAYMISGAFLSLAYFDLFYAFVALAVILSREVAAQSSQVRILTRPSSRQFTEKVAGYGD